MGLKDPTLKTIASKYTTYRELMKWRLQNIGDVALNHNKLNEFHDILIQRVVEVAVRRVESEWGPVPAHFAFFLMGSGGRFEQSVWSDQDHGIIHEGLGKKEKEYFLQLGEEISSGLAKVGYLPCEGHVMASNLKWCKTIDEWKEQLITWMKAESWESIRYVLTFIDSRVSLGKHSLLKELRTMVFLYTKNNPYLLKRMLDNVGHLKKGIGIFGQLLVEPHGPFTGCINIKNKVLFPYVNAIRLLAIKEGIEPTSTRSRFQCLSESYGSIKQYEQTFNQLLSFRLQFQHDQENYESVHYLRVSRLSKDEKKLLKQMIISGNKVFKETKSLIEKRCQL